MVILQVNTRLILTQDDNIAGELSDSALPSQSEGISLPPSAHKISELFFTPVQSVITPPDLSEIPEYQLLKDDNIEDSNEVDDGEMPSKDYFESSYEILPKEDSEVQPKDGSDIALKDGSEFPQRADLENDYNDEDLPKENLAEDTKTKIPLLMEDNEVPGIRKTMTATTTTTIGATSSTLLKAYDDALEVDTLSGCSEGSIHSVYNGPDPSSELTPVHSVYKHPESDDFDPRTQEIEQITPAPLGDVRAFDAIASEDVHIYNVPDVDPPLLEETPKKKKTPADDLKEEIKMVS